MLFLGANSVFVSASHSPPILQLTLCFTPGTLALYSTRSDKFSLTPKRFISVPRFTPLCLRRAIFPQFALTNYIANSFGYLAELAEKLESMFSSDLA